MTRTSFSGWRRWRRTWAGGGTKVCSGWKTIQHVTRRCCWIRRDRVILTCLFTIVRILAITHVTWWIIKIGCTWKIWWIIGTKSSTFIGRRYRGCRITIGKNIGGWTTFGWIRHFIVLSITKKKIYLSILNTSF
jgi:hypothetical protein